MSPLPVAVIGAGPVGLAAAAHLIDRGETPIVLEAGAAGGANVREWGHVRLFSPWRYNTDKVAVAMLEAAGWRTPDPDDLPTGGELVDRYLSPLAALPPLAEAIAYGSRVTDITRRGLDKVTSGGRDAAPFILRVRDSRGRERGLAARAVIDASGTWANPNPLGADGLPAIGEAALRSHVFYGIPDVLGLERERYAGRTVLVVGAGHSAANGLLLLAELAAAAPRTRLIWTTRGRNLSRVFGGGVADALPARGRLGSELRRLQGSNVLELVTGFRVTELAEENDRLRVTGAVEGEPCILPPVDEIVCATGQRPDLAMTRELRMALDPVLESVTALGPLIDPNLHSCGTVPPHGVRELAHPEPDFYTVGIKSYGRAPTFLMMTGYEQVRSVAAAIAGDMDAALDVRLELPKTGVCIGAPEPDAAAASSCCVKTATTCCAE